MANCYKLISCHPSYYPSIELVNHPDLDLIYDADPAAIVGINGDATQGYTLEKYIRVYWDAIGFDAEYVSGVDFNAYTLTTFVYNGVEYVTGLTQAGTIANPGPITQLQFLNDFVQSIGLDLNFVDDGSGNIAVLLQDTDTLDFDIVTTGTDGGLTYGTHEYFVGGGSATYDFDGSGYSAPAPGFVEFIDAGCDSCDDVNTVQTLTECPNIDPFNASLINEEGEITINEIDECLGLNIEDATIYTSNTPGHNLANFTDYIRIELTRGDGSLYIMSSIDGEDVDEVITAPASNPSHYYPYYFLESMEHEHLKTCIELKKNYIRKTKGRDNRLGHNWEAVCEWFIEKFTKGAHFWTQKHRSNMDSRRITLHLLKSVGGRRINAEVDRVWEVTPGLFSQPVIYVL